VAALSYVSHLKLSARAFVSQVAYTLITILLKYGAGMCEHDVDSM